MRWGFEPANGGEPVINIRAETADVSSNRCLIPASDFELFTGADYPKRRWRIAVKGEPLFFFAGLWRSASAAWPLSYAALTIEAAPDLKPLTDRQMALIRASDAATWLTSVELASGLLKPLPPGSYEIEREHAAPGRVRRRRIDPG